MSIYIPQDSFNLKFSNIDLEKYFSFIKDNSLEKQIKFNTANHHILPRWAFPEYGNLTTFKWNKAILTHKNHLIAHFILWDLWRHAKNASPLMLMCSKKDRIAWDIDGITEFSELYHFASTKHGESVSLKHTGKIISEESIEKGKNTRIANGTNKKGMMNCILMSTGESVHISTEEYKSNKNILYKTYTADKPAWNTGISHEKIVGKLSVILKETTEKVFITTQEYKDNKHLYVHPSSGLELEKGLIPAINIETGKIEIITTKNYHENKDKFKHSTTDTKWFNNGIDNLRLSITDVIPEGYIPGRVPGFLTGIKKKVLTCPHCGKTGGAGNMTRYHFDFCKILQK